MHHFRKSSARTRSTEPTALKDVMSQYLETYQLEKPHKEASLRSSWIRMMGKPISDRTKRLFVQDKTLFVELTSAPLKQELSMSGGRVRDFLNKEIGERLLDKVVFI